ncbi:hypothetical protein Salat_0728500 [Sesamum alatum]|uniref:Uncharacterized protein n=1 Tax=Sesamum alatum TaxID=300844 RepID=A0AAE2CV52_9LAMI|nr:hypothetical protein Salat_0728500 [Sesamum alatum]
MAQDDCGALKHDKPKEQAGLGSPQPRRYGIKSPPSTESRSQPPLFQQWRGSPRSPRTRNQPNWAYAGPGMQAVFLGSSPKGCGTGVFLPRKVDSNFQSNSKPTQSRDLTYLMKLKPRCSNFTNVCCYTYRRVSSFAAITSGSDPQP